MGLGATVTSALGLAVPQNPLTDYMKPSPHRTQGQDVCCSHLGIELNLDADVQSRVESALKSCPWGFSSQTLCPLQG